MVGFVSVDYGIFIMLKIFLLVYYNVKVLFINELKYDCFIYLVSLKNYYILFVFKVFKDFVLCYGKKYFL